MKEVLNASEAARVLGIPAKVVRFRIEKGIWTFGRKVPGKKQGTYIINTREMYRYFDMPIKEGQE